MICRRRRIMSRPLWHKEVLQARENAPASDWVEAKERIRNHASGRVRMES